MNPKDEVRTPSTLLIHGYRPPPMTELDPSGKADAIQGLRWSIVVGYTLGPSTCTLGPRVASVEPGKESNIFPRWPRLEELCVCVCVFS